MSAPRRFIEYPDIRVFSVHPGTIKTAIYDELGEAEDKFPIYSTVGLYAATVLYLTAGQAYYLSGRYVASTWDLGEVERDWREKIVTQNCLVNKLSVPV
jgi:NAD(P)-dependent dehydrogenase (short-subunit alcohol dehydrogenase family)